MQGVVPVAGQVVDTEVLVSEVVGRGTVLAGRYRVLAPVESDLEGASAWQATDQILDRPVRVRILEHGAVAPALDAARRAALVTDSRLVRVLDVGTHEGYGYVVSEQLVGPSLARLVANGPLNADQARAVVGEAASALEVARRRGVHHLALRPSVLHVSPDGRVLLGGLALDAALLGDSGGDARSTTRADAVGLVRLLYAALTGLWPADPRAPQTPGGETLPPAPVVDGSPVAPADLVPGVPNDLDTLCVVTLGPNDDGPHSPGELVRELEPWGEIRASVSDVAPVGGAVAAAQFPPTGAAAPGGGVPVPDDDDPQDPTPVVVQRQSVRAAFQQQDPHGANRPGTPPPATPARAGSLGATAAAADTVTPSTGMPVPPPPGPPGPPASVPPEPPVAATIPLAAALASPPVPPAAPLPAPPAPEPPVLPTVIRRPVAQTTGSGNPPSVPPATPPPVTSAPMPPPPQPTSAFDFGDVIGAEEAGRPTRLRFDPTALVLIIVAIVVIIGVVLAFKALFSSVDSTGSPDHSASQSAAAPSASAAPSDASAAPSAPAAPAGGPPVIASATTIDPSDGDGEHQEDVAKAFDGDPSTFWYTQTYKRADFAGFKPAVGYAITLTAKTTVTTVTLHSNSTGGNVEIRATDAAAPTTGAVLASGPFGADSVFTLNPATETQSLVLWITELPTMPDGSFRLELTEISLS